MSQIMRNMMKKMLVDAGRRVMKHYASGKRNTMPVTKNARKSFRRRLMRG